MAIKGHNDFAETEIYRPEAGAETGKKHRAGGETLSIQFTGSGSEYFRIWIVNLLLVLVTFTLYLPFARARRMAYFQNNTLVGGDPLGFHADPWKMFRGYLVVVVLGLSYWAVSNFLPAFSWLALSGFAVLWPLLWRASLQFRLGNTSWRGVRFSFKGDIAGAYMAMLPFFLPALASLLLIPAAPEDVPNDPESIENLLMAFGASAALFVVFAPWFWKRLCAYQHGGYAYAQEQTDFTATSWQFYGLTLKLLGVFLLLLLVLVAFLLVAAMALIGLSLSDLPHIRESIQGPTAAGLIVVAMFASYVLVPLIVGAYYSARMQNLLWLNTQSARLRMVSQLRFGPLLRVKALNWLLIVLTLGLFWPFAKVRLARVRLEAMSVEVDGNVADWVAQARQKNKGVLGDAAGDFFGMDMGL